MSNVLSEAKRQQVIALGRLGWPLRRIEQETGVRRETASAYLKAAGVGVRPPGALGRRAPAKPANEVTTGSDAGQVERTVNPNPENLRASGPSYMRKHSVDWVALRVSSFWIICARACSSLTSTIPL